VSPAAVVAVAGEETRGAAVANRDHPKTVVLDLEQPVVAVKGWRRRLTIWNGNSYDRSTALFSRKTTRTQGAVFASNAVCLILWYVAHVA